MRLLAQQAPTWLAQMPWLIEDDEFESVQRRLVGATHERMLREMLETLKAIGVETPIVLVLEDMHWSDPSTIDLLEAVAKRREPVRLLVLGTYRRGEAFAQDHPVHRLEQSLRLAGSAHRSRSAGWPRTHSTSTPPPCSGPARPWPGAAPARAHRRQPAVREDAARIVAGTGPGRRGGRPGPPRSRHPGQHPRPDRADAQPARPWRAGAAGGSERGRTALLGCERCGRARPRHGRGRGSLRRAARSGRFLERHGEDSWPDGTIASGFAFSHDLQREVVYERVPAAAVPDCTATSASGSRSPTARAPARSLHSSLITSSAPARWRAPWSRFDSRPSRPSSGRRLGGPRSPHDRPGNA